MSSKGKIMKWLSVISILLCASFIALFALYLFASGTVDFIVNGPKIVMEEPSPDGQYIAYVEDLPSLDGPNQALLIERKDKTRFLGIAKLAGDVDSMGSGRLICRLSLASVSNGHTPVRLADNSDLLRAGMAACRTQTANNLQRCYAAMHGHGNQLSQSGNIYLSTQ